MRLAMLLKKKWDEIYAGEVFLDSYGGEPYTKIDDQHYSDSDIRELVRRDENDTEEVYVIAYREIDLNDMPVVAYDENCTSHELGKYGEVGQMMQRRNK